MDVRQSDALPETSRDSVVQGIVWQAGVLTSTPVNDEAHFTDDVECVSVSGSQESNNILNLTFLTCTLLHPIGLD